MQTQEFRASIDDMYENLALSLDRADELLREAIEEYDRSLRSRSVSSKAVHRTYEVCVLLKSVLDRTVWRYWELHIFPQRTENKPAKTQIYFPAAIDRHGFDSMIGRWPWGQQKNDHQDLRDYLLQQQSFQDPANRWLPITADLAIDLKHLDLVPQERINHQRMVKTFPGGGQIIIGSTGRFGPGFSSGGTPLGPTTQHPIRFEEWVSFVIAKHNVDAAGFCHEACAHTRRIVLEMTDRFGLS